MSKRLFCVIMFALVCVSMFAGTVKDQGTYQGKHWQIVQTDASMEHQLVVHGKTILSLDGYIKKCTLGEKLYFEAVLWKSLSHKLYTINGDLAISHEYSFITPFEEREGIFRVATRNGEGKYESELYNADLQLVLPRYKYFWSGGEDDNGNIKFWVFTSVNGYEGWLANDWKTWIVPITKQFTEVLGVTISGIKYYECKKGGFWGLYDAKLNEVIAPDYDELSVFAGTNFIKFKLNGFCGVMTLQGRTTRTIIPTTRGYTNISRYVKSQKIFTFEMDGYKGECNHLGRQVSKIKVANSQPSKPVAPSTISSSSSSNKTSSSSSSSTASSNSKNSSNNKTTVVVEHHRDPVPVQEWVKCGACLGDGRCSTCGGSGRGPGSGGKCISCGYSGKCHFCNGQGGHYQTFYR